METTTTKTTFTPGPAAWRHKCYYNNEYCQPGELWQCQTCGEWFCEGHWHETAKGRNVECCACAYNAADFARDFPEEAIV